MKIAHLTTVDSSLRFLVFPQLVAVVEAGGEALGISAPGPWVAELREAGIRHVALPSSTRSMNPLADVRAAFDLWRILRRERPTVLHTHNPKPGLYGRVVGRLAGVPIVINTVHGLYATEDDPLPKRLAVYLLESVASRFSNAELVQNPEDLELMVRWRISPPKRTILLGNGVDLARFSAANVAESERMRLRRELGVADDQIVVGSVGRLVAEKGYPELFEAAHRLGPEFVVVCVGPDDPEKSDALPRAMIDQARARGVRILGMQLNVERYYRAMDLFVLASHREGFPRAAMEAAAMSLPIVATDVRGCRQVVRDGVNGFLVPVGDVESLTAAIRSIGGSEELRIAMSEASRSLAESQFDERKVVDVVMTTYEEVARRKGIHSL